MGIVYSNVDGANVAALLGAERAGASSSGTAPSQEIELRLLARSEDIEALKTSGPFKQFARNGGRVRHLRAAYFDTPDRLLRQAGLSLAVRQSGRGFVQTLKRDDPACDFTTRAKWETSVVGMQPELDRLPVDEPQTLPALKNDALEAAFSLRVRRHCLRLDLPDATVEAASHEGLMEVEGKTEPLSELELELKSGEKRALFDLALSMLQTGPLRIETRSKAERGFALLSGETPRWRKATPSDLASEDTVDDATGKLLGASFQHVLSNLAAAEDGSDPEGVHQMRVSMRRLRTALSIFSREIPAPAFQRLSEEGRALGQVLGPARNWDVFLTETMEECRLAEFPDTDVERLLALAEVLRAESYMAVREAIAGQRTNRFLLTLGQFIESKGWRAAGGSDVVAVLAGPLTDFSARALSALHRKARKQGRDFANLNPEERHRLRLRLKKLRYATEFFLPLHADKPSSGKYLKRLVNLQDGLGADNDMATTKPLLMEIAARTEDPLMHRAIGAIIGWQRHRQLQARPALSTSWKKFKRAGQFWVDRAPAQ